VTPTPTEATPAEPPQAEPAASETAAAEPEPEPAAQPEPAAPAEPVAATQPPEPAAQVAAIPSAPDANPESPAAASTPSAGDGASEIVVRAKSDSWIQIRDGIARRLLVTRLLRAGDSYRVPDKPGLTLLTGNAGALEILVGGEAVAPIGGVGAVRRNVALDAESLRAGTAVLD